MAAQKFNDNAGKKDNNIYSHVFEGHQETTRHWQRGYGFSAEDAQWENVPYTLRTDFSVYLVAKPISGDEGKYRIYREVSEVNSNDAPQGMGITGPRQASTPANNDVYTREQAIAALKQWDESTQKRGDRFMAQSQPFGDRLVDKVVKQDQVDKQKAFEALPLQEQRAIVEERIRDLPPVDESKLPLSLRSSSYQPKASPAPKK